MAEVFKVETNKEKKDEGPLELHILIDMKTTPAPTVYVSFKGTTKTVKDYKTSQSARFNELRHIRVGENGIRFGKTDGEIVE
jgi:hypothetical protein